MKNITTLLCALLVTLSTSVYGQDTKMVTTSCTIVKPIAFLMSPELNAGDGIVFMDTASITIKWDTVGNGGICEAYISHGGDTFLISSWRDESDLHLLRTKRSDGRYTYSLCNGMFTFWSLTYIDILESYGFDSTLKECD